MQSIHILFGFDKPDFEKAIKELLKTKGYEANIFQRQTKLTIKEYLETHTDCNTVVLKGTFNGTCYSAEELAELTDLRDINVIVVVPVNKRGLDYMRILYAAGITNAIFQKGRKGGGSATEVAALILKRRGRKEAREYYGISSQKIDFGFLENETYEELYQDLKNGSGTLIENYVMICSRISPQQIADFVRRMPQEDRNVLAQYKEFHVVAQLLKKVGQDLKIKKPKNMQIGLAMPIGITLQNDAIYLESENKTNAENKSAQGKETVIEKTDAVMSMASFFTADTDKKPDFVQKPVVEEEESSEPVSNAVSMSSFFANMGGADIADEDTDPEQKEEDLPVMESENVSWQENIERETANVSEMKKEKIISQASVGNNEDDDTEKITFDGYESKYKDISLDSGTDTFISKPFMVSVLLLVVVIIIVYVSGNRNIIQLF